MTIKTVTLPCPTCKTPVLMTDTYPDRPFCSARCKSIDFGEWANESFTIEASEEQDEWSE